MLAIRAVSFFSFFTLLPRTKVVRAVRVSQGGPKPFCPTCLMRGCYGPALSPHWVVARKRCMCLSRRVVSDLDPGA